MKQNEHIATIESPESMRAAMECLPAVLAKLLGSEIVLATYGWGCNLHPELCYIPVQVGTSWLGRFIEDSVQQRIVVPGYSDFIFSVRTGELEIEFCHEHHIHISGTNTSLISAILAVPAFSAATLHQPPCK